jgi:hypothetical protein
MNEVENSITNTSENNPKYYLELNKDNSIKTHCTFGVNHVDFMTVPIEIMIEATKKDSKQIIFFESLQEVRDYCRARGVFWFRIYNESEDSEVSNTNWIFHSTYKPDSFDLLFKVLP